MQLSPQLFARARLSDRRSQDTFSSLMAAVAEPGTVHTLPPEVVDPAIPACAWLALALADVDVTVSVDDDPTHPLAALIRGVTGASSAPLDEAWLVVLSHPGPELLDRVAVGDPLHPERGARVALPVTALHSDDDGPWTPSGADPASTGPPVGAMVDLELTGPGVPGRRTLRVVGLGADVAGRLGRATGAFPAGFDTWLFTADGRVAAVPRSTTVVTGSPPIEPRSI